jgi:hypothetical protein
MVIHPFRFFPQSNEWKTQNGCRRAFFVAIPGAGTCPPKHVMEEMREEGIHEIVTPGGRCCRVATAVVNFVVKNGC